MRIAPPPKLYDDLNVTPLMDLAWNLLIVFVIMATATVQGIAVSLPKASSAPSLARPNTKAVTVAADGHVYLGTEIVTLPQLEARLVQYRAADPRVPVVVKGDARIQYQRMIEVLDVIKRARITELGLVTQTLVH
jgi:biopolymer transport protein ExbD